MASEKKPSIYSDRSTIGSTDELDEYGVWVKSEPQDLSSAGFEYQESAESPASDIEELPDFNADFGGDAAADFAQDDFGIPDETGAGETEDPGFGDSLDFDDLSIPEESSGPPAAEAGFTEVSMEDFLDTGPEALTLDEPVGLDSDEDGGFAAPEPSKTGAGSDLSTQLLMKIADELSSIRSELSVLKKEFSGLRGQAAAGGDKGDGQKKGFFDEAEDEKIALTGDELDNILNTADFTEEAGANATEELPAAYPSSGDESLLPSDSFQVVEDDDLPDLLSSQADLIGAGTEMDSEAGIPGETPPEDEASPDLEYEDEDQGGEDDIIIDLDFDSIDPNALVEGSPLGLDVSAPGELPQELADFDINLESDMADGEAGGGFNLPSAASEDAGEGLDLEDSDAELQQLMQEGVQPMTAAPEDTSYLDDEPAEEDLSLDELSLDEASLDEASLGEASLDEASLDEASLDEASLDEVSLDETSLDETILDESSLDLSNAVIDEPDLSNQITENPLQEPSLEDLSLDDGISIDMDMEEGAPGEAADSPEIGEEELELSIPGEMPDLGPAEPPDAPEETSPPEEENFAQVIPEGFVVESEDDSQGLPEHDTGEDVLSAGDIDTLEKSSEVLDLDMSPAAAETEDRETSAGEGLDIPTDIKQELRTVLSYMDQLLESLPEEKIEEFAKSEYFDTYKKLFKELGLD
jgi:hypothetical protein